MAKDKMIHFADFADKKYPEPKVSMRIIYCADRLEPHKKVGHLWMSKGYMRPQYPLCDPDFKKKESYSILRNYPSGKTCKICLKIEKRLKVKEVKNGKR